MAGEDKDVFGMSDEDFAKLGPSSFGSSEEASASSSASEEDKDKEIPTGEEEDANAGAEGDAGTDGDTPAGDADADAKAKAEADEAAAKAAEKAEPVQTDEELLAAKPPAGKEPAKEGDKPAAEGADKDKPKETPKADEVITPAVVRSSKDMKPEELAGFYDQVMKPFKANGRDITLRSPEEAIRLMQMGAGYGRKLQDMQPHLKTLRMLEKNDLLDEGKLSYLIDLDKKNPDAIKKLIKDAGLDPLDLNIEDNASYRPTNHGVSDTEVAFSEALKDVSAQPGGRETIQHINTTWDQLSKEAIWAQPELLGIFQSQRENGLYDQITAEVDRKKMLGEIKPNTPFIEAYKIAGDALVATNSLILPAAETAPKTTEKAPAAQAGQQPGRVLGTRTAAPKSAAANNDKAKAAASPSSSTRKAKEIVNPLDMADDDFLKQFNGRI